MPVHKSKLSSFQKAVVALGEQASNVVKENPGAVPVSVEASLHDDQPGMLIGIMQLSSGHILSVSWEGTQNDLINGRRELLETSLCFGCLITMELKKAATEHLLH